MSIPFFFHPFRITDCPQDNRDAWQKVGYFGDSPENVIFMDGGIMSNFPINLFHEPYRVPMAPTFGAKIGFDRGKPANITKPVQLLGAVFDAARHTLDFDFVVQNPDFRQLVTMIDTGDHNWLDFHLTDEAKIDLFARGAGAAADFLCQFNWQNYKKIREGTTKAFLMSINVGSNVAGSDPTSKENNAGTALT